MRPIPLPEFRTKIATIYTAGRKAPKTTKQLDHALRLVEAEGAFSTADLTTEMMARVLLSRGEDANPFTSRGILRRLKRACNMAIRDRHLDQAPDWESLWPRCPRSGPNKAHSSEQVGAFLEHLRGHSEESWYAHRLCALGWLVALTGLRRNEALFARTADLDLNRGFLFVRGPRLKTEASAAPVPLPDCLSSALEGWVPRCGEWLFPGAKSGTPWHGGAPGYRPKDRLEQAGRSVGIEGLGFHTLRHSLATHLLRDGVPTWAIQRILRHTTPITTEHYLHPSDHDVARLVRGFHYQAPASKAPGRSA